MIIYWSDSCQNKIPANEEKYSWIAHTMTAEVEKKFEVMQIKEIIYDIKDLYPTGSI